MLRGAWPVLPTFAAILLAATLSGCLGGSIAQQVSSTIATQAADKVIGNVIEQQASKAQEPPHVELMNMAPDPFMVKFLTMQFPDPPTPQAIVEPLPAEARLGDAQPAPNANRLVPVELLNLVIGEEKQAVLERGLQNGSAILPPPAEWPKWKLATGALQGSADAQLFVLLPPDFGRVGSGTRVIVEIADTGGIHIARYRAE
ncbi:hypothetical protein GALL_351740 [mine drainage metagenome]|uniref:Lipoprotein n=1 Tax=mine drainage metagenome TaxID=410659 RepID=A0A1J5QZY7_9ZZZZ